MPYDSIEENVRALLKDFTKVGRFANRGRAYANKEGELHYCTIDAESGDMAMIKTDWELAEDDRND